MATDCNTLAFHAPLTLSKHDIFFQAGTDADKLNPTPWLIELLKELIKSLATKISEYNTIEKECTNKSDQHTEHVINIRKLITALQKNSKRDTVETGCTNKSDQHTERVEIIRELITALQKKSERDTAEDTVEIGCTNKSDQHVENICELIIALQKKIDVIQNHKPNTYPDIERAIIQIIGLINRKIQPVTNTQPISTPNDCDIWTISLEISLRKARRDFFRSCHDKMLVFLCEKLYPQPMDDKKNSQTNKQGNKKIILPSDLSHFVVNALIYFENNCFPDEKQLKIPQQPNDDANPTHTLTDSRLTNEPLKDQEQKKEKEEEKKQDENDENPITRFLKQHGIWRFPPPQTPSPCNTTQPTS